MKLPVSVLIPTYNPGPFLLETLESILTQDYGPAEVIVVDDGSAEPVTGLDQHFGSRVRCVRTQNGGICRARNVAASFASSPYLAFCDHDDIWRHDKLSQQMSLHEQNPALDYSFTNFVILRDGILSSTTKLDGVPADFFTPASPPGRAPFVYPLSLYRSILNFQPIFPSTIVLSRQLFARLGGFREEFGRNPAEDVEFTLRCVQHPPIGVVRDPVVYIRKHDANTSRDVYRNTLGLLAVLEFALENHHCEPDTQCFIQDQLASCRTEASLGAFQAADFEKVVSLLNGLPSSCLDRKLRVKYQISRLPEPLARLTHRLLLRK